MRLTRLRVKNFRSIADIDIPLSPLTVLVGPNGSGKSNVVDALRFVRDVFARGLDQAVMDREGMGVIQRWGTEGIEIGIEIFLAESKKVVFVKGEKGINAKRETVPARNISYSFAINEQENGVLLISEENLLIITHDGETPPLEIKRDAVQTKSKIGGVGFAANTSETAMELLSMGYSSALWLPEQLFEAATEFFDDENQPFSQEVEQFPWEKMSEVFKKVEALINSQLFYTLNPTDLRQPQQILKENPFDERGRNLAAVVRRLIQNGSDKASELKSTLRRAVVGFNTIAIEPVGGYLAIKLIYQTDNTQPRTSYIGQESDGTIRMLGLLAALYQDPPQPFLSIEEPEANIHPGALAVLASVLDEASLRSQVLVTTHSPDMLDHLPAESFLVVEKVGDTTHVGPLDASQLASVRKRLFTPGELLRMEGLQRQTTPNSAA
jgi:predicted ATPase